METKNDIKYSKQHEWVKVDGNKAYVGISDYAQNALGEIVFVDLPIVDTDLVAGDSIGAVESIKTASDIYSPISGKVIEINEELIENPEKVNTNPYESWIAVLDITGYSQPEDLMNEEEYIKFCAGR